MTVDTKNISKSEQPTTNSTDEDLVKIVPQAETNGAYEVVVRGEASEQKTIVRTTPRPFALAEAG